ncbi:metal-dependent hydrolase [Halopelagius fulvigenes]|uniref:Metal-dependent hydrolase n=1 Tax=Halopelagius fulvigenes TaxID=1198324 RepID=A0ABD5TUB2_9EURY
MMVTTHAAAGLLLAVPVATRAPELAVPAVAGALVGGVLPDFDLFVGVHRRTLHFPVYYTLAGVLAAIVAFAAPTPLSVALALCLLSAGLHSISDWFGAGEELRPWERTSPRAVYVHPLRRWLRPKYVVRYDGAPEDFLLTVALAAPAAYVFDGGVRLVVVVGVLLALAYTVFRKRVPDVLGI